MAKEYETVLGIAQVMIRQKMADGPLSREAIAEAVEKVLSLDPSWRAAVDSERLVRDLETRFDVWIGRETTLEANDDHVRWLDAERAQGWRYWPRYRQHLESSWAPNSIDSLDRVTDRVLSLLEDPNRGGAWDRRGLVVGHVQSGKTSNYTGLICKGADAGYKLIVVLSGLHKNLRSQTQMRLDEGFLGYETLPPQEVHTRELRTVGAGLIDPDPAIRPDYVTNRADNGDFNRTVANNLGISPGGRPLLFVIKKNVSVLRNLQSWVDRVADARDTGTGRPIVRSVPLLVIDDEADLASVDTRQQDFDEEGQPDSEHDPTAINRRIRRFLFCFEKSAYVGYTATPFANIYIHEQGTTAEEWQDLFPRSFIMTLPAPSNYVGPVRIFGLEPDDDLAKTVEPLPLYRSVTDHAESLKPSERAGWMPPRHVNGHVPRHEGVDEVPPSLRHAVYAFILSCAARRQRGHSGRHNSMLVHVTRYTVVQHAVFSQVESLLQQLRGRLVRGEGASAVPIVFDLRRMWEDDFVPTTAAIRQQIEDPEIVGVSWERVEEQLARVVSDISVREINGTAGDVLDYDAHHATGLNVIAIGGDKLARGLTLEGLTISYFLRASRMYDTLMQMGRWFGYRPGYLDLCRLYTTPDLAEWFQHITEASEELRQEFDHMVAIGGTPKQYGLRVRSHPALMVTSRVKMRHGTELQLSFARSISETVVFHRDAHNISMNFNAAERFIRRLGAPSETDPTRSRPGRPHRWSGTCLWSDVSAEEVMVFLDSYTTHDRAVRVHSKILREFIEAQVGVEELTSWTVALMSGDRAGQCVVGGRNVAMIDRSPSTRGGYQPEPERYVIRRLLAPRDEAIDLELEDYEAALQMTIESWREDPGRSRRQQEPTTPSGPSIRERRNARNGLLLLYPLSPQGDRAEGDVAVIGFGISFPSSPSARTVTYTVNNVYSQQEFG